MSATTSLDRSSRVFRAAYPHFARLSSERLANVRDRYPKTCRCLLKLALNLVNEEYGIKLLDRYRRFSPDETLLDFPSLKELLVIETEPLSQNELPEILSMAASPSALPKEVADGLRQIFEDMVENLINYSHLTTEMLQEEDMEDKALDVALSLHHPLERSKALLGLISYRIRKRQVMPAAALYPLMTVSHEKQQAAAQLVAAWLQQRMVEAAVTFSGEIEDEFERNHALQEVALCMARQGQLDECLALIDCFSDADIKAYALSRLVNSLATAGDFDHAVAIACSIQEKSYQQDAFSYILKKLIVLRRLEEAIEVAGLIPDMPARLSGAKLIERALASYRQDAKVRGLYQAGD